MKNEKISISVVSSTDWQQYRKIRLEMLRMEPQAFSSLHDRMIKLPDNYWLSLLQDPNSIFIFAKINELIVGTMRVTFNDVGEKKNTAIIRSAYVTKEYRRLGVGKALLTFLLELISHKNEITNTRLYVRKSQIHAIKLYESMGFTPSGTKSNEIIMDLVTSKLCNS